jgi:hypothetical protein
MRAWSSAALLASVFVAGAIAFAIGRFIVDGDSNSTPDQRQTDVATRGQTVMPFDLESTTHVFQKTEGGGLQTVTVDDSSDTAQIGLIQAHLRAEADRFAAGDFSDPAGIHGADMPGLAELSANASAIHIEYSATANGATIRYSTDDAALVSALHRWFDAQVSDHGGDATGGTANP